MDSWNLLKSNSGRYLRRHMCSFLSNTIPLKQTDFCYKFNVLPTSLVNISTIKWFRQVNYELLQWIPQFPLPSSYFTYSLNSYLFKLTWRKDSCRGDVTQSSRY